MKKSTFITVCGAVLVVFCGSRLALNAGQTKEQAAQVAAAQEDSTAEDSEAEEKSGVIAEHISIEGVDVSGMTETQAKQALQKKVDEKLASDFELSAGDSSLHATADDLQLSSDEDEIIQKAIGYAQSGNLIERFKESKRMDSGEGEDFALSFSPASYAVERFLKSHEEELSKEQINNSIVRKDGEFVFVKGESGYKVNVDNSVEAVREYFEESWDGSDCKIDLALDEIEPQGKEEDFAKIHDALGTYTTEYGGSPSGRKTNIINGAAKVNGSVLLPGEEISVAKKLQPITEENGYAEGTAYENGQVVPSIGGGVYQISSTLYNAAILAELDITERSEHSMTVSYVDPSRDAAIAGDVKDLKFKNNLDSPIYIDLQTSDSAITATIFGEETRPANREVEFEAEILGRTDPKTVYVADGSQPIGYKSGGGDAHTGYSAQLLKIVKVDGEEQSREVFNKSYYSVKNIEYHIGTASASGEASAAMHAAVASQDIGAINAAISQWNASAVAARAAEAQAAEAQAAEAAAATGDAGAPVEDVLGGAVAAE